MFVTRHCTITFARQKHKFVVLQRSSDLDEDGEEDDEECGGEEHALQVEVVVDRSTQREADGATQSAVPLQHSNGSNLTRSCSTCGCTIMKNTCRNKCPHHNKLLLVVDAVQWIGFVNEMRQDEDHYNK